MTYIPLRIDFVEPETHCTRISDNGRIHGFKSGKATFLLHESDGRDYLDTLLSIRDGHCLIG